MMNEYKRIEKLRLKHEGYGGAFGFGTSLENSNRRRKTHFISFDKNTKKRVERLFNDLFENTLIEPHDLQKIKNYVLGYLLEYHNNSRRKNKHTLIGCGLDITILAITDSVLRGIIVRFYMTASHSEKKLTYHREIINAINKIEKLENFQKVYRKGKWISEKENPKEWYDLYEIDKSHKFDIKELTNLFRVDEKRYKEQCYLGFPITKEHIIEANRDLGWYAKKVDQEGFLLALRFIEKLDNKNKKLRGLFGACSYVYAKNNFYKNNHWIISIKSISKWAKVYNIDREVFSERVKLIESCGFF